MEQKYFRGESLELQYKFKQAFGELRVLDGFYGLRLIYRGELGALMGGDRSHQTIQAIWDSLEVYEPKGVSA